MSLKRRGILGLLSLGVAGPAAAQLTGRSSDQLLGGGLIALDTRPQPFSVEESAYPKWEYKVVNHINGYFPALSDLGAAGWELAATYGSAFIFKRRIPSAIHLHVNTFDPKSMRDSAETIADAVHAAINNGHPVRNAISEIAHAGG